MTPVTVDRAPAASGERVEDRRTRHVVVGFDGSRAALPALTWAAIEAQHRGAELHVLLAGGSTDPEPVFSLARSHLGDAPAGFEVDARVPVEAFLARSNPSTLLVLGRRNPERDEALLGPVSHHVAAYAHGPVAIVPLRVPAPAPTGPTIAVGVGRSGGALAALDAAMAHALERHGRVLALRAWGQVDYSRSARDATERLRTASGRLLTLTVREARRRYPGVEVDARVLRGAAGDALLLASHEADLLVMGGRYSANGVVSQLGETATSVLSAAFCPVEVVNWPEPLALESPRR
jgi:nucleotide-binding universal stress UspA family protein